jgi:hypothetical protein
MRWIELMKISRKCFLFLAPVFCVWISTDNCAQGQTRITVSLSPSSMSVQPGAIAELDVRVDNAVDLFAASIALTFDTTILHYNTLTGGPFLTGGGKNSVFLGVVPYPPPPSTPNRITVDQAIAGGGTVSGSGVLFTIGFAALRKGSSPVTIDLADLRDGSNAAIPAKTISGQITVNNPPAAVELLSPPDGSTIDTAMTVTLIWSNSIDADTDDAVRYDVHLISANSSVCFGNLPTISLTLTKDVLEEGTDYTWYVDATDGIDTTSSMQIFTLRTPLVAGFERYRMDVPAEIKVEQSYPNPFNSSATIRFAVPLETHVNVTVYDLMGRKIARLMSARAKPGRHSLTWNGKNDEGIAVGSGIYVCLVTAEKHRAARKMILLR